MDIPWGNNGMGLQGVCAAAIYSKLGVDSYGSADAKGARCFMERELGYLTNHKCSRGGDYKCSTGDSEGWSYMVGCALLDLHHACSTNVETGVSVLLHYAHVCAFFLCGCQIVMEAVVLQTVM